MADIPPLFFLTTLIGLYGVYFGFSGMMSALYRFRDWEVTGPTAVIAGRYFLLAGLLMLSYNVMRLFLESWTSGIPVVLSVLAFLRGTSLLHRAREQGAAASVQMEKHVRMGVQVLPLEKVPDLNPSVTHGVYIGHVNPQSPAGRGGIRTGDILLEINGDRLRSPYDVELATQEIKKGHTATVVVFRQDDRHRMELKF